MRIDRELLLSGLKKAEEYSLEETLKRCGASDIPVEVLSKFDRLMMAKDTDELSDLTTEDIITIAKYSKELTGLYKTKRFLSNTTFSRLKKLRAPARRRVL